MTAVAAAVLRPRALALLLLARAATSFPASTATASGLGEPWRRPNGAAFLLPSCGESCRATRKAAHAPDLSRDETTSAGSSSYCYVPPYGTVSRSSAIVLNMSSARGSVGGGDVLDDRFRKKMNSRRGKDPVVQDFGEATDWQRSKTGLGRMGDDKAGDDGVSELFDVGGPGGMYEDEGLDLMDRPPRTMDRRPPPVVWENSGDMMFEGEGGNYWVNPPNSMDRYPRRNGSDGMMARRGWRGRGRNRRRRDLQEDEGDWWETRRGEDEFDEFDKFDEDSDYEYGVPPPSRSRSSFRSGAPPPPRPVKDFYDRLFWFGFDPDVTRPTDRTMFGGTRGKFNAMDMLRDREERQKRRGGGYRGRMRSGLTVRGRGRDSVIQDFGSVDDWDARKSRRGRAGGAGVGDDRDGPHYGYESALEDAGPGPFPSDAGPSSPLPGNQGYDLDAGYGEDFYLDDGLDFEGGRRSVRRRDRGGRRRRRDDRRFDMDRRAEKYDRFLAGVGVDEYAADEDYPLAPSSRRRRGFAYKYNHSDLLDYDEGEFIDVEPKYTAEQDLSGAGAAEASAFPPGRWRRSWEERAIEMDRVPPRGAVAWGPDGEVVGDPLDRAAREALEDIRQLKRHLERKERKVDEAKEEVVNLKADASFCQNQLEDARGRKLEKLEQELGYLMQNIEDASRNLRMARAEMDDASIRVRDLEERNWALLSEYEAGRSFEEGE